MKPIELRTLYEFIQVNENTLLPTKLSIKIAKLKLELKNQIQIYSETLNSMINACAKKDEDNKPIIIDDEIEILPEHQKDWEKHKIELETTDFPLNFDFSEEELQQLKMTPAQAILLLRIN